MRSFCKAQQIVLLAIGLAVVAVNLKRPIHSPVPLYVLCEPQAQRQWAVEITGPVAHPGIYTFHEPPSLSQALQLAGPIPTPLLLAHMATVERLQSGTRLRPMRDSDGSWRIVSSAMDPKKMLVLGIPFDVNDAGTQDLALVPGISQDLAQRIVAFSDSRGPFRRWEDLRKVKGVGPVKIKTFRQYFRGAEKTP
ncbi:MAG: helix-hairpin-helix domain-containing protein [Thermodesulfobacteriota bacterium]|nr:helix-hairpin-helix domain-containing protein [Thermodesulfobacteriota bacterium]